MPKENFLLVSLEEPQAKQLTEVLSNETSRRIINHLTENKDSTESQLSQALNLPLPTIHYNLKKLKEACLVTVDEFHYSSKGREVDHYRLANKYVIITPKPVSGIKTHLRNILPVSFIIAAISGIIHFMQKLPTAAESIAENTILQKASVAASYDSVSEAAVRSVQPNLAQPLFGFMQSPAFWFFTGGIAALILVLILLLIKNRFKRN